jgi:hypothetical protein
MTGHCLIREKEEKGKVIRDNPPERVVAPVDAPVVRT